MGTLELVGMIAVLYLIVGGLFSWLAGTAALPLYRRFGIRKSWLRMPDSFCPRCEQTTLQRVDNTFESYPNPTPHYHLCENCGARWMRLFNGLWEDDSAPEHDYYFSCQAAYFTGRAPNNGNEPLEVVPFDEHWFFCPNCDSSFMLKRSRLPGQLQMHKGCGQLLQVMEE